MAAFCEKAGPSEFNKIHSDKRWSCNSNKEIKILESSAGKMHEALPICLYDVKCERKDGQAEPEKKFVIGCKLEGDHCLDLEACAEEQQSYDKHDIRWVYAKASEKAPNAQHVARFGEKCTYDSSYDVDPNLPPNTKRIGGRVVERMLINDKENTDYMCASPVKGCNNVAETFVAACDFEAINKGKDGKLIITCPPAPSCLATAVTVKPAMTQSKAKALAANAARRGGVILANTGGSIGGSTSGGSSTGGTTSGGTSTGGSGTGKDSDNH